MKTIFQACNPRADVLSHRGDEAPLARGPGAARQESIITPTAEEEIAPLVTHRLFAAIDRKAGAETAVRAEYKAELERHYPFSPEPITALNRKTSSSASGCRRKQRRSRKGAGGFY